MNHPIRAGPAPRIDADRPWRRATEAARLGRSRYTAATADLLDATDHLPWGLHDAHIMSFQIDYPAAQARLHVRVPTTERQDRWRAGTVHLDGLLYLTLPVPGLNGDYWPMPEDGLWIDADRLDSERHPEAPLPPEGEGYWVNVLFVGTWNAFALVALTGCSGLTLSGQSR